MKSSFLIPYIAVGLTGVTLYTSDCPYGNYISTCCALITALLTTFWPLVKSKVFTATMAILRILGNLTRKDIQVYGKHCVVTFYNYGMKYQILLPYNQVLRSKRRGAKLLLKKGSNENILNHYSGIPILVSPDTLGVDSITVKTRRKELMKTGDEAFDGL